MGVSPTTGQFPVVPAARPAPRRRVAADSEPSPIADDVAAAFAPGSPWSAQPETLGNSGPEVGSTADAPTQAPAEVPSEVPSEAPSEAAAQASTDGPSRAVELPAATGVVAAVEVSQAGDVSADDTTAGGPAVHDKSTEAAATKDVSAPHKAPGDTAAEDAAAGDRAADGTAAEVTAPNVTAPEATASEGTAPAGDIADDGAEPQPTIGAPGQSKNTAPEGFPNHRTPSARAPKRPMPGTASTADAAARSAAARSAARSDSTTEASPAPVGRRGGNQRNNDITDTVSTSQIIAPRQEASETASSLAMFFESDEREPVDAAWPTATMHVPSGHRPDTPVPIRVRRKKVKDPRSPAVGLASLLLFAFVATFFAWFSAAPLWLTLGHGRHGVATVANCPVAGIDKRCAEFTATDASFSATVTLLGPASEHVRSGTKLPARMVSDTASTAYAGDADSLYLRWVPGVAIALLCGLGVAWSTGSFRLPSRRGRVVTVLFSLFTPIALIAGMLAVTY